MSASDEGEEPDDGPEAPHPYRGPAYAKPSLAQGWRSQHSDNLLAALHEALLQHDFERAAGAAATLLLVHAHLGKGNQAEAAQAALVSALIQAHNLEEAYDALCELPGQPLPSDARFHCLATQGMLRHAQWAAAQRAAAAGMPDAGAELDWFAHDPVAGARAGRQAAEFWRGAVAHLREALALRPAATELSYVLAQLLCAGGQHAQAAAAAAAARAAARAAAPGDADAAALHALLLVASGRRAPRAAPRSPELAAGRWHAADAVAGGDAGEAYLAVLRCDPSAGGALAALLRAAAASAAPPHADVAEACLLYLDVCGPACRPNPAGDPGDAPSRAEADEEGALAGAAWHALAGALEACARAQAEAAGAGSRGREASDGARSGASGAPGAWARMCGLVADRRPWWAGYHFGGPGAASAGSAPPTQGDAPPEQLRMEADAAAAHDAAGLAARARVAGFVLGPRSAFCGAALAALQAAAGAPEAAAEEDPALGQAAGGRQPEAGIAARALAEALRVAAAAEGAPGSAPAASELPGAPPSAEAPARQAGASSEDADACSAGAAGQPRPGGETEGLGGMHEPGAAEAANGSVRRAGGRGVGYGEWSAEFGTVRPLPEAWWAVFPQKRRRLREGG